MYGLVGRLEPPEPQCDGAYTCDCCGEIIPGGESMYVISSFKFCEICIEESRETAPYREEVYEW